MKKLDIIYEDKELLVVNKPCKLLCISDGKTINTLYNEAYFYVKRQHKSNKIFIVHRLDKDTSGVVLFAKNEKVKKELQNNWNKITKREYLAVVEGHPKNKKGIIKEYLKEDKTHRVYASLKKEGEYAETHYEVIKNTNHFSVLKIEIKTGKKNQIRVAMQNMGNPIVGDKKYGSQTNPMGRLGLHHEKLTILINNKKMEFEAKIPQEFKNYLK